MKNRSHYTFDKNGPIFNFYYRNTAVYLVVFVGNLFTQRTDWPSGLEHTTERMRITRTSVSYLKTQGLYTLSSATLKALLSMLLGGWVGGGEGSLYIYRNIYQSVVQRKRNEKNRILHCSLQKGKTRFHNKYTQRFIE